MLDACLQVIVPLLPEGTFVPVALGQASLRARLTERVWVHARVASDAGEDDGARAFDLTICDEDGRILSEIGALRMAPIEGKAPRARDALDDCMHVTEWRAKDLPAGAPPDRGPAPEGAWLVITDARGVGAAIAGRLRERGGACVEASVGAICEPLGEGRWRLDPTRSEHLGRLLAEAFGRRRACRGVVYCAPLDAAAWEETSHGTLEADVRSGCFAAVRIAQALLGSGSRDTPRLVLLTRGAQAAVRGEPVVGVAQAPLWGLGKTIAMEHPELECARIDLPASPMPGEAELVARELVAGDGEDQVALRREGRLVARLVRAGVDPGEDAAPRREPAAGRPFRLEIRAPGVLDRLCLREVARRAPGPGEVEIAVEVAGLNFLDVLLALGALPDDAGGAGREGPRLGSECAGRIVAVGEGVLDLAVGDEVIALAAPSMGTHVVARREVVVPKPARLTWEQAATAPTALLTAHYALARVARLQRGERVLIHAGAGGVGMAAIQWAQRAGAEVFATAGSEEKRALLREAGVRHVFDSRSLSFVEDVRRATDGGGVDVVLNSLSGEFIPASLALLRDHGRFVEIGKRDCYEDSRIGLRPFLKNLSFSLVDLRAMIRKRSAVVGRLLAEVIELLASGALRPLPCAAFPASRASEAFNLMAQGKHTGKIAIRMGDPEARIEPREAHRGRIAPDAAYLITGGLGGLGLSVARWMVERGARHLALVGRSDPPTAARAAIRAMEEAGAEVHALQADVARPEDVADLLARIEARMPPLRGVVHAAAVLDDRVLLEMGEEQFWRPIRPKVLGAWNLHVATRRLPLDFFVMYSSAASLLGAPGQGNYAAANAFMDALAHARGASGLPAMSLQWGPFAEVGLAAAQDNRGRRLADRGLESFTPDEGTELLGRMLRRPRTEVGLLRLLARRWIEFHPQASGAPFLSELEGESARVDARAGSFRGAVEQAAPAERAGILEAHVVEQLGRVLRLAPSRIDRRAPFSSLGVDSLMSLELRNRLEASLGVRLSTALLFTYPNPTALAGYLLGAIAPPAQGSGAPGGPAPGEADPPADDAAALEQLAAFEEYLR
jgi:NADPH:quinone reductase-like Zn-dependent oxidoreductase/NAD(P)-dependent dehydrogenase (short-subunit alcohol dehydrogenase family)/acyl carrier protein